LFALVVYTQSDRSSPADNRLSQNPNAGYRIANH